MKLLGLWVVDVHDPLLKALIIAVDLLAVLVIIIGVPALIWGICAAIEKLWAVLRGQERLRADDPWRWLKKLPRRTKNGWEEYDAQMTLNGGYDMLYLDDPLWWTTEEERERAEALLRERGYDVDKIKIELE